jgi:hypothetical protein
MITILSISILLLVFITAFWVVQPVVSVGDFTIGSEFETVLPQSIDESEIQSYLSGEQFSERLRVRLRQRGHHRVAELITGEAVVLERIDNRSREGLFSVTFSGYGIRKVSVSSFGIEYRPGEQGDPLGEEAIRLNRDVSNLITEEVHQFISEKSGSKPNGV